MPDATSRPWVCHWCHGEFSGTELVVAERDPDAPSVNEWVLCSWACAHELVTRMLRTGRDAL